MANVHKSVLVQHSAKQLFALVEGVEDYPAFLPWCGDVQTLERNAETALVRIGIDFHGVRAHFTTANTYHRHDRIVLSLRDGPFRKLDGLWIFRPLAEAACKVELALNYEFATAALEALIGPVFNRIAGSLIDAFVRRAETVYAA
jgi:ribosome-associated toxin RatA of RatAB toxin-antitoxin module